MRVRVCCHNCAKFTTVLAIINEIIKKAAAAATANARGSV